jgi:hypothetical protein
MDRKPKRKETWFENYMNYKLFIGMVFLILGIVFIIVKAIKEIL